MSSIRKAEAADAHECAELLYASGPSLYEYIFGLQYPEIIGFLEYVLMKPGFYTIGKVFAECEGSTIRGMYLAYSVKEMKKLMRDMAAGAFGIFKKVGLAGSLKMISRFGLNSHFPKLGKNEYFLSNIAVKSEERAKGTGTALLKHFEEMAKNHGSEYTSLYVEIDNESAIRFYEKNGYQTVKHVVLDKKYQQYQLAGFNKMMKRMI